MNPEDVLVVNQLKSKISELNDELEYLMHVDTYHSKPDQKVIEGIRKDICKNKRKLKLINIKHKINSGLT